MVNIYVIWYFVQFETVFCWTILLLKICINMSSDSEWMRKPKSWWKYYAHTKTNMKYIVRCSARRHYILTFTQDPLSVVKYNENWANGHQKPCTPVVHTNGCYSVKPKVCKCIWIHKTRKQHEILWDFEIRSICNGIYSKI